MRFILIIISFFYFSTSGQIMHIGVLRQFKTTKISFSYLQGDYVLQGDAQTLDTLTFGQTLTLSFAPNNQIKVEKNAKTVGFFNKVALLSITKKGILKLKQLAPSVSEREYQDDFSVFNSGKSLTIVNDVDLSNYLVGVVESEGGGVKKLVYYKVQAIISRTYAVKNKNRHQSEGFDLCDRVHCQAYNNRLKYTSDIRKAVDETHHLVLIDSTGKLIDAFFHANCGGQTSESEYVWNESLSYLHSFRDTFCIHTTQATWKKEIPQEDWKNYLVNQFGYPMGDSVFASSIFTFDQPNRVAFYKDSRLGIPLRDLRTKFNLRSTFFSCHPEGDKVILEGRGYGHGIGLCQEGAMNMAKYNYTYKQILSFYFIGARLILLENIHYFNQKEKSPFDF